MVAMARVVAAECLKSRRTAVFWLALLTPLGLAPMLVWYLSYFNAAPNFPTRALQTLFETWAELILPVAIGLMCGLVIFQEEQAGNFNGILGCALPRPALYLGKLLFLILLSTASTTLVTLAYLIGIKYILGVDVAWVPFLLAAGLAEVGVLPLLALNLWVSFGWGKGAAIALGGAGGLVAALYGGTSLGTDVWPYIPWAWGVRMALFPAIFLPGGAETSGQNPFDLFWGQTLNGLIPALGLFLLLATAGAVWFLRWEGRSNNE